MNNIGKGNALLIHGGGLCEPSKLVLMRTAKNLVGVYDKIYIGRYSFEALLKGTLYQYGTALETLAYNKRGTYFGTSRGIDLTDPKLSKIAISYLKSLDVRTVIVEGGDGSSRQVAELNDIFMKNGINIIFPIPLTVDGINGGISIGVNEAVRESVRQIENMVATGLQTRDNRKFGVVIAKLQGRNRDDILAGVLKYFCDRKEIADIPLNDILLRVIPANEPTDIDKLFSTINNSEKRTLIFLSEGAKDQDDVFSVHRMEKKIERKTRSVRVGHASQSNNMVAKGDLGYYIYWIDAACEIIAKTPHESFSIVNDGVEIHREPIDYYAKLNPRSGQKAKLPSDLNKLIRRYMERQKDD